jgi:chorismate lyase/3-hydroxybenzoate synthase
LQVRAASQTHGSGDRVPVVGALTPPVPPPWVAPLVAESHGRLGLLSVSLPGATGLTAPQLSDAVALKYRDLGDAMSATGRFPVRIWNFVPGIQAPMEAGGDRYMAFNLGRFIAYADWFGNPETFSARVPTASAVGVLGDTLWIFVLVADVPGVPIENPRQIPAYLYSRRYGIRPPCFARATRFEGRLLIGGTASIVGEDSRHADSIDTQTRETFRNIAALIDAGAHGQTPGGLCALLDLRVHLLHREDAPAVQAILDELVPHVTDVEFVEAQLCRKELLVEIEGRARL